MKYECTLITVRDLERSKRFYCGLLGMQVTADFGANITLSDVLALQTLDTWQQLIQRGESAIRLGNNAMELYFEESDFDGLLQRLAREPDVEYVHPVVEQPWGQRGVRLYDPDHHIVEIGEEIAKVAQRFLKSGMTLTETAKRMDVAEHYIRVWAGQTQDKANRTWL